MKLKRIFAAMSAALVMAFAMPLGVAVNAEEPSSSTAVDNGGGGIAPATGSGSSTTNQVEYATLTADKTATLKKYLVLDENASVPDVTFDFEVEAGDAVEGTTTAMEIKAGRVNTSGTGTAETVTAPTVSSAHFTTDGTTAAVSTNDTLKEITEYAGKKFAVQEITFNLTGVTFNEPGIYRYKITEKALTTAVNGITQDTKTIYADVYVTNAVDTNGDPVLDSSGNPTLQIAAVNNGTEDVSPIVFSTGSSAPTITPNDTLGSAAYRPVNKTDGFINEFETHDLYFAKKVDGNQASRDKFFKFTVEVEGLTAGYKLTSNLTNAVASPTPTASTKYTQTELVQADQTKLTADTTGKISADFFLQDGQYIIIKGIPEGAVYTVKEAEEDYKKTAANSITDTNKKLSFNIANGSETVAKVFEDKTSDTVAKDRTTDIYTGYLNEKDGIVPTGIVLGFAPVIIIGIAVTAGIIFLVVRRKKDAE